MIDEYTYDGVHPTDKGYEVMEKIVLSAIKQPQIQTVIMDSQYSNGMQEKGGDSISHFRQVYVNCILN